MNGLFPTRVVKSFSADILTLFLGYWAAMNGSSFCLATKINLAQGISTVAGYRHIT